MAQMEVYNRYFKAMYNSAYRIVKDRFEAEDIMQDAFLMAFSKLDNLKDSSSFGAWLKRIVINKSIQQYNRITSKKEQPLDDVLYKIEDQDGIESDHEFVNIKAKQIMESMSLLKPNYRVALSLYLVEGYDTEEISSIMDISNANCRTTISRAKESLRRKMLASIKQ